ncbi:MAG: ABC transporter ATP-binding protein, partial [Spirochaetota bacterium]|nr:ABC transporter ATP-binding protein [Spirochaetota bacterium]
TTLMRILTGYMPATYGSAFIDGMDISEYPKEIKKKIGYLPENCPLYPEMTVTDYLKSMAELKGLRGSFLKERLDHVLEAVKITDRRHHIIGTLSKGYKQRVGLAQSLIHDPELLILDEPTVGLDPSQIIEIRELIRNLKGDRTVILSTHILPEVSQTCERIIIISNGSIAAQGSESELIQKLSESGKVYIRVGNKNTEAEAVIRKCDGVKEVKIDSDGLYEIEFIDGQDQRARLAKDIVSSGIDLLELRGEKLNLEDIFIHLTREN